MALRDFPLDGALLRFDRDTGTNMLVSGDPQHRDLRMIAPRVVQFGITNRCNLACTFCSRDLDADSAWTPDSAFAVLAGLARAGVLEVAFGGGEPFVFRGFANLVRRLHAETPLAVNITTNGIAVTRARLAEIAGAYGQIRVSLYDDNAWRESVALLAGEGARFGVNYLVTPARLPSLATTVLELAALGCRDVLLLAYKGRDRALHLSTRETASLATTIDALARALRMRVALDVCWGERLAAVPRLFATPPAKASDCGAGREFVVVTSDRRVMPCSFHDAAIPFATADDIMTIWRDRAAELARPATLPGCARAPQFGLHARSLLR